ncbi:MAG TPA: hypothetical protein VGG30_04815, partial [Pirellulales bacterium]
MISCTNRCAARLARWRVPVAALLGCCFAGSVARADDELRYNWKPGEEYGYNVEVKVEAGGKTTLNEKGTVRFRAEPAPVSQEESAVEQAQGTGFFVNRNGYLLT